MHVDMHVDKFNIHKKLYSKIHPKFGSPICVTPHQFAAIVGSKIRCHMTIAISFSTLIHSLSNFDGMWMCMLKGIITKKKRFQYKSSD